VRKVVSHIEHPGHRAHCDNPRNRNVYTLEMNDDTFTCVDCVDKRLTFSEEIVIRPFWRDVSMNSHLVILDLNDHYGGHVRTDAGSDSGDGM
jgi:hypothetical protein